MKPFRLPDLGEGLQSAEIVAWHVAEGEHVVTDQPLLSVETEKAVVEIPSPQGGRIARLLARPGDRVEVGEPLLEFEEGPHPDAGTVVGELDQAKASPRSKSGGEASVSNQERLANIQAAPAVRAKARDLGIDLSKVTPSGPDNSITMADVMSAAAAAVSPSGSTELRGARRTMALKMARAWREVVHATIHDEADIAAWPQQEDVAVRAIRAIVAGCKIAPNLNASFNSETLCLNPNEHIDLGLAIDSSDGLFVPVLRDVAGSLPAHWRRQIESFKARVRNRSLTPADLRNPTITLSNFGTIAGTHAALVIMPPQVAILGVGRISKRPLGEPGGITLHSILPLSLTFDHRAISGGEAARFLRAAIEDLQQAT
jgi:pyruvate dehydrogenase E2 component (dihydrolipoamide acetyltransferase)